MTTFSRFITHPALAALATVGALFGVLLSLNFMGLRSAFALSGFSSAALTAFSLSYLVSAGALRNEIMRYRQDQRYQKGGRIHFAPLSNTDSHERLVRARVRANSRKG